MLNRRDRASTIVKPLPEDVFVDHREEVSTYDYVNGPGYNAEMRWEAMSGAGYLTPTDRFYVRSHAPTPTLDATTWSLRIEGDALDRPFTLDYKELRSMPSTTVVKALECAGNGRVFFEEEQGWTPPGTAWRLGAVGVAEWTGTPLRGLLERAGICLEARDVMAESLDAARMRRPIPVGKAMDDALVVWAMNGEDLEPDHGFPARLIVPGWGAVASVKWLGRLFVSSEVLHSPWNTEKYVMVGPGYNGCQTTIQVVKSAVELPWPAKLDAGRHTVTGRSWSPDASISRVEYSLDGGGEWSYARLDGPNLPGAWACWSFDWEARPGNYGVRVTATDERGRTQPDEVHPNDQGYLYGGIVGHPVEVS